MRREGRVYDVWITFGSVLEVRAFRERMKRSLWFRGLVENTYIMIIDYKTGALFGACMAVGALMAGRKDYWIIL